MARRILLLNTDLEIGGTPTVVRELAVRLHRPPDVHVEVACLSNWGPVAEQIRAAGVTVTALGLTRSWQLPRAVSGLRWLVREHSIDTVFSFLVHANVVAALALRKLPHVRFIQSIQTTQPRPRWHWRLQRMVQTAERTVVPSPSAARVAAERAGPAADRVAVIPNAVDVASLAAIAPDGNAATSRARPEEMATRVGFLGRLDPIKRVDLLIRAMRRLAGTHLTHFSLHVFGDGPLRRRLELLARTELAPQVEFVFHGAVASPAEALKQIDILVLPSDAEGFGMVLIEAMAARVPVVATDVPGIRDVVRHERTGLLVPPGSPAALAAAIRRVSEDPALAQALVRNGLAEVREKYSWESVLPQYRKLLGL